MHAPFGDDAPFYRYDTNEVTDVIAALSDSDLGGDSFLTGSDDDFWTLLKIEEEYSNQLINWDDPELKLK